MAKSNLEYSKMLIASKEVSCPIRRTLRSVAQSTVRLGVAVLCGVVLVSSPASAGPEQDAIKGCAREAATEHKTVCVVTERDGDTTRFFVENRELGDVTMTFEVNAKNLKGNVAFPYTATFPPGEVTEAFTLAPVDLSARWEYSYTNYFKLGSNCARHDDNYIYDLPYLPGYKFKVTQGYNGKFSHTGANQYATDWQMPEGTLVLAARAGLVIRVKDDSNKGGGSMAYDKYNNYVLIQHDDGTLAHYCHLQKGGCLVKPGQRVAAGDAIAHSGNTGFSSGPHLHFCVFKTRDGRQRLSLPVKFKTSTEASATLLSGHSYRAPEGMTVTAKLSPASDAHSLGGAIQ